jgi:uncharacterized alkaline shock family protein YloU
VSDWSSAVAAEVEAIAAAVLTCPAVAALHGGPLAQTVTLLPGRRIEGVQLTEDRVRIGVVAAYGAPVALLTAQVHAAVRELVGGRPVDVHVGDLQLPEEQPQALPAGSGS